MGAHSYYIRRFIQWLEARTNITTPDQLTVQAIMHWRQSLSDRRHHRTGLPLKPQSIRHETMRIRIFLVGLVRSGHLPQRVLAMFPKERNRRILPQYTPDHKTVRRYLRSLPDGTPRACMLRVIAELLYTTAMRPSEALSMDVDDIDFENGLVRVMGKGRKERMLPFGRTARRLLTSYLEGIRPLLLRDPQQRALWLNSLGGRLNYHALLYGLHNKVASADGGRFTCYSFRRACATEMIRADASLWMVKLLLGHGSYESIQHYVNLTVMDLQKTHARCHPRDQMGIDHVS